MIHSRLKIRFLGLPLGYTPTPTPMCVIKVRQTVRKFRGIKVYNPKILNFKKPLNFFTHFLNAFMDLICIYCYK